MAKERDIPDETVAQSPDRNEAPETSAVDPNDPPLQGAQVLGSRTGVAIWTFIVLSLSLYFGHRLITGKPLSLPKPKYFPSERERPLRSGPLPTAAANRLRPPPKLETTVQEIEEPPGSNAMEHFFRALRRTDGKQPGAITRVCHWGDSQIVSDNITSTIRRELQVRFGDAGHGFLSVGRPASYLHADVHHWARDWKFSGVARGLFADRKQGLNGMHAFAFKQGPVSHFGTPAGDGDIGRSISRLEVSYLMHSQGGRFNLSVDGKLYQEINTRLKAGDPREAVTKLSLPDGRHSFSIHGIGFGLTRIFGVVLERDVPGLVYDSLGLKGAQMHDLLRNNPEHWARQLQWRRPDLVVFGFGTNESYQLISIDTYVPKWIKLLTWVRKTLPKASCLVLGPVDRVYNRRESHPRTAPLDKAMRKAALAAGCAYWDTFKAMGGPGAAARWRRADMMWGDLAHMNPKGGRKLGTLIAKALVERYQAWLQKTRYEEAKERLKQQQGTQQ